MREADRQGGSYAKLCSQLELCPDATGSPGVGFAPGLVARGLASCILSQPVIGCGLPSRRREESRVSPPYPWVLFPWTRRVNS